MKPKNRAILETQKDMSTEATLTIGSQVRHRSSEKTGEVVSITQAGVRVRYAHDTEIPILDKDGQPTGKFEQTFTHGDFAPADLTIVP